MGRFGKLMYMGCITVLVIGSFAVNVVRLGMGSRPLWDTITLTGCYAFLWFVCMGKILFRNRVTTALVVLAMFLTLYTNLRLRAPATARALDRVAAVADVAGANALVAPTIQTYTDEPCSGIPFFGTDPLNGKPVPLVGYVYREGRYRCFNIQQHLDRPGVDTNGDQIQLVTREVSELIRRQIARDVVARSTP